MSVPVDEEDLNNQEVEKEQTEELQKNEEKDEQTESENKTNELAQEYLNLAKVIQADFDNFRKRSVTQITNARLDGIASTVEVMLPCLDAFKKVKETVTDEKTLEGIEMLEKSIYSSFEKLGVTKIDAIGLPLDPNVHNALAVAKDETKEDGIILDEFQAGFKMEGKIIRCSQVLVNKL